MFKICESSDLGRHIVATCEIKPGEIILQEKALVSGPEQITGPICLGCGRILMDEEDCQPCSKCGWPVCDEECEESINHIPECEMTAKRGYKVNIKDFTDPHPTYQGITIIRCLYLRDHEVEKWEKLKLLKSHDPNRKLSDVYDDEDKKTAEFVRNFYKLANSFTEDDILNIIGTLKINGHCVPLINSSVISIYESHSLFKHDCRPNCYKSFTENGDIIIVAATDIKSDEVLSVSYVDSLLGTANRRLFLNDIQFLQCNCSRCQDPTDSGTMYNAMKCQESDCEGFLLPRTFINNPEHTNDVDDENTKWYCDKCSNVKDDRSIQKLLDHIGRDLAAMEKDDVSCCELFIDFYQQFLHANHYYMIAVCIIMIELLNVKPKSTYERSISDTDLNDKTEMCKKINDLLKIVAPAEVRLRGKILYELQSALTECGRRKIIRSQDYANALIYLRESKELAYEVIQLLQHEPETIPEGKIKLQAEVNVAELTYAIDKLSSMLSVE